ncbi:MAG: ZIP family zinc transporter [Thermoleophilia bacterium]|nr:ZIP family zinc transporter [Thermoleophilia bacterium]
MGEAFLWGALGALALLVGAVVAYELRPGRRLIAVVMALGTGLLIGSVSFELIEEALETQSLAWVALLLLVGAAAFAAGDWLLERRGGANRKDPTGKQGEGSPQAIVLGSILDGIPESFVLGLTVLQGGVSLPLLGGILLTNLPEGMASSSGLRESGWARHRVLLMWAAVVLASGLAALAGYAVLDPASGEAGALIQAFAAGALLAMLADTLLPEAYAVEGVLTGPLVVAGLALSLALSAI